MKAVPDVAKFEAGTFALNCSLLTNVVAKEVPFQLTVEPGMKPAPSTVNVRVEEPVVPLEGTSPLSRGTG
jgi:hypothetical protein